MPTLFDMFEKMGGIFSALVLISSLLVGFLGRPCREFQLARNFMKLRVISGVHQEAEQDKSIERSVGW